MAMSMADIAAGWLGQVDSVLHSAFDPLRLEGVGTYWRVMLIAFLSNVVIFRLSSPVSAFLMPKVYSRLSAADKRTWCICTTSLIHTILDSAVMLAYLNSPDLNSDKMDGYNEGFEYFLAVVQGYYIWDMVVCLVDFSSYGFMYVIHAGLGIFGLLVLTSRQLQFYAIPYLLPELSSVFLNIRFLLKLAGHASTLLYRINFAVFVLVFVAIRMGFENYHSYQLAKAVIRGDVGSVHYPYAVYFAALGVALMVLNVIWLRQITVAAYYTLYAGPTAHAAAAEDGKQRTKKSQ
ncbi:hypothetical protein GQ54DRAFT_300149 [Martensiomyces pterosporus]|nr:hypothetical protein GQ54DRAFT_300149 [Martensiomyces pterosporus]